MSLIYLDIRILKQQKTFIYLVQKIQENMQQKYLIIYQNQKQ